MTRSRLEAVVLLVFLAATAAAPARAEGVGLGLRAGTQGAGAEIGLGVTRWLAVRGGIYGLTVSDTYDEGGINYDGDLKVGGTGVLADFFPFRGSFHVTAGLFSNDNEIELLATPTQPQEIGGTIYSPADIGQLRGVVAFDDTAPYLGIGWGRLTRGKRVGFLFDLGILEQGSGRVQLAATGSVVSDTDLQAEARQVESDIRDYDIWPVISFGLAIRFGPAGGRP